MRILIVDNDVSTVVTLTALLQSRAQLDIDVAYGGQEGLAKMKTGLGYDLILLDIMMPQMSGMDVCLEMAKDERLKRIPVLLMSSAMPIPPAEFQATMAKSGALGMIKGALEKPFTSADLLDQIYRAVRH